jgi:hypothetical protein
VEDWVHSTAADEEPMATEHLYAGAPELYPNKPTPNTAKSRNQLKWTLVDYRHATWWPGGLQPVNLGRRQLVLKFAPHKSRRLEGRIEIASFDHERQRVRSAP